jgi:hypothetical protein
MIRAKDDEVLQSLLAHVYHPILGDIVGWINDNYGIVIITEGARLRTHANDLHADDQDIIRAVDCRSWIYKEPQEIVDRVNLRWIYDHKRIMKKVLVWHESMRRQGKHFHIQVHPNTYSNAE